MYISYIYNIYICTSKFIATIDQFIKILAGPSNGSMGQTESSRKRLL